jgi:hypothetical protein
MNNNKTVVTPSKIKNKFWDLFGKLAALIAVTWGSIQIFNFVFKKEFKVDISGSHYEILIPTFNKLKLSYLDKEIITDSLYNMIIKNREKRTASSFRNLEEIKKYYKYLEKLDLSTESPAYKICDFLVPRVVNLYIPELTKYSSLWTIKIDNFGDKPLEDLFLELPFDGVFETTNTADRITSNGSFVKRINLGTLRPKYQILVKAWRDETWRSFIDNDRDEKRSRVTHKYGSFVIKYPIADTRFYTFFKKHQTIIFYSTLFLLCIIFIVGVSIGYFEKEKELKKVKVTSNLPSEDKMQTNEDENKKF